MSSYVSADFEKDYLATSGQVRVIVRGRDDGTVPPKPSSIYFPTEPNDLSEFIIAEYVSDVIGERFVRVATQVDIGTVSVLRLMEFHDPAADFVAAGVVSGDILEVTVPDPELWTSSEYGGTNPFIYAVDTVVSATNLLVAYPFPAFQSGIVWDIPTRSISGIAGVTRRVGSPVGPVEFREARFNNYFSSAATAASFVTAVKAAMVTLATDNTTSTLTDESFTAESDV